MSVPYSSLMRYLFPALLLHGECGEGAGWAAPECSCLAGCLARGTPRLGVRVVAVCVPTARAGVYGQGKVRMDAEAGRDLVLAARTPVLATPLRETEVRQKVPSSEVGVGSFMCAEPHNTGMEGTSGIIWSSLSWDRCPCALSG